MMLNDANLTFWQYKKKTKRKIWRYFETCQKSEKFVKLIKHDKFLYTYRIIIITTSIARLEFEILIILMVRISQIKCMFALCIWHIVFCYMEQDYTMS